MVTRSWKRARSRDGSSSKAAQRRRGRHRGLLLSGAAAGAALTYYLDPDQGRRRRARLRDKVDQARRETVETADLIVRDSRNHSRGLLFEAERLLRAEAANGDGVEPEVETGTEPLQKHWAPTPRALAGALGGAVLAFGIGRRGLLGIGIASGGGLLLARAATNEPVRYVTGIGAGPNAVEVDKSIHIDAPVDQVWEVCEDYESFPTFMSHVRDVREEGDGVSHWKVDGPLGSSIEWDAEVTEIRPNEVLAWRSRPGSAVQHAGEVALEPANGGSHLHVRLAYNPTAGVAGHAVARLFGADAKKQLDDDLRRMKTTIEMGRPPRDVRTQT